MRSGNGGEVEVGVVNGHSRGLAEFKARISGERSAQET